MKRTHLNGLLVVAVAGLGAVVWFSREQVAPVEPLTPLTEAAITRLEVAHTGKPAIRLEREGEGPWQLVAPVQARADNLEVNGILSVASLPVKRAVDASVDRAVVGLAPPQYTVTLNDRSLAFGGMEPLAFQRYVDTGDRVVLVDDPPSAALDADYSDLVSKQLVAPEATLVAIETPDLTLTETDGIWQADEHPQASADRMMAVVNGWREAQAMWNGALEDDAEAPTEFVTLRFADGRQQRYGIARREPQFELVDLERRVRHTLSRALVDTLLQLPAEAAPADDASAG